MARNPLSIIVVSLLLLSIYLMFAMPSLENLSMEITLGVASSILIAVLISDLIVKNPKKSLDVVRWFWAIAYILYYFFIAETRAHIDVAKRILNPKMPIRPGIVAVPHDLKTDYGVVAVANSITNTPGTVVVDLKTGENGSGMYFVHWIDVKTTDPEMCRRLISEKFEQFVKKIFE